MYRNKTTQFWSHKLTSGICSVPYMHIYNDQSIGLIDTKDKIISLVLNILFTEGEQRISKYGTEVGNRGGHWSTSFSGAHVGTVFDFTSASSITDMAEIAKMTAFNALQRLITYEVATEVQVDSHVEHDTIVLDIAVYGTTNEVTKILIQKSPLKNSWVWE